MKTNVFVKKTLTHARSHFQKKKKEKKKKKQKKKKKEAKYYLLIRALINKDDHKDNYKEIIEKLVKERFDKIKELSSETNDDDLKYYFKRYTTRKRFDDFNNAIELFRNIQSGEMKLEEAKTMQYVFKSNLNERSRGRNKSEEQKMALQNIKLFYE